MKKSTSFWVKVPIFLSLIFFVERFCHHETAGFRLSKIQSDLAFDPRWEVHLNEEEKQQVQTILDQPFYFLGSGGQCYAFLSQDGSFVLKFFKHQHMRQHSLLNRIALVGFFERLRQQIVNARKKRLEYIFGSCKMAYECLKEETGLIAIHLNKTSYLKKQLTLLDKLGIAHQVRIDEVEFVLQRKADLVYTTLSRLMESNNISSAKNCLDSLLELIVKRCKNGVADRDPIIKRNFGFIGEQAIEIDLGSFIEDPFLKKPYAYKKDLFYQTIKLRHWLKRHYPPLSSHLEEQLYRHLENSS
ncbi:MAG: hypothetical protein ACM3JI_05900 [Anaerolineae bacterium]